MEISFFVAYRARSSIYRSTLTGVLALALGGCSSGSGDDASGGSAGNTSMTAGGASATGGATSTGGASTGGAGASGAAGASGSGGVSAAAGSSGTGGSGGSSGACEYTLPAGGVQCSCPTIADRSNCTATLSQPILDDGEWVSGNNCGTAQNCWNGANRGDFGGWWGHWLPEYDLVKNGGTCFKLWEGWFPGNPAVPMPNPADANSKAVMAVEGAGCSGAGGDFYVDGIPDPGCENLSAFKGFTFDIMADHEMDGQVFVAQTDAASHDLHTMPFTYKTEWQRIDVPFCALTNSTTLNVANVAAVGFRATGDFKVYIDDIIFY